MSRKATPTVVPEPRERFLDVGLPGYWPVTVMRSGKSRTWPISFLFFGTCVSKVNIFAQESVLCVCLFSVVHITKKEDDKQTGSCRRGNKSEGAGAGCQEVVGTESSFVRLGQEGCPEEVMSEDLGELSSWPRAQRG